MKNNSSTLVQKVWSFCDTLRDDGVSYGDYVEQLTYLLFLKMADEQTKPPLNRPNIIPKGFDWESLIKLDGGELELHYRNVLQTLSKERGLLGVIFRKSQNKIQDPAKLKRLLKLIDEEVWVGLDVDIKGEIYEGLLEKNAQDTKSGAGQYFTPRALINAMVKVTNPKPEETIADPACGTGGFFLEAHDYITNNYNLDKAQKEFLKEKTFSGWDIVDNTARLCAMNLFLHGIGGEESPVTVSDSLMSDPGKRFDIVLTNPPFGKKSSVTITNGEGVSSKEQLSYEREDFWATTSNKQLNFLQHISTILKIDGRAAVVLPDNVLFEAGKGEIVRKKLLQQFNVHTILRLPTGIFYAQGVKANVVFFEKRKASEEPWTKEVWYYDLRTNMHFTLKERPLSAKELEDFIKSYNAEDLSTRKETERFKKYTYEELIKRDNTNLDIFWIKDDSLVDLENLPEPEILLEEIIDNLKNALEEFESVREEFDSK
ncbi:SAM-dependent DNA methyltransferase [Candidatus Dojkabacteria bacterium]|uniref:site-specific DNA-methyltransferase (adenine-specific) n=1 Tax=Candidatus Dojkabacteria bacterium TaxID=2099670 RepID=A0A955I7I1_9BACT|nr:SAM-dependent DNA methyltransferase [Candidatus Dojkabacteria bacterium]